MRKIILLLVIFLLLSTNKSTAQNWVNGGNNLSANGKIGVNTNYSLIFETDNKDRGRITSGGNWGIGTSSPSGKFHINSATGANALRASVNGSTKLLVHSGGGVSIGSGSTPPANGLYVAGNASFGVSSPGSYKVKITHGTFGFNIENASSLDDWELWSNSGGLSLYANSNFRGNFSPSTGAYSAVSDGRLKTNIQAMPSVLEKISNLHPAIYQFKDAKPVETTNTSGSGASESYGFIAQEVMKYFPHLVTHHVDKDRGIEAYTLDYSGFGVIAIKGIQELQSTIELQKLTIQKQQQEINEFKERFAKLEAALELRNQNSGNSSSGKELLGVSLEQNWPNPFGQITTFRYTIPAGATAKILIYDVSSGSLVKSLEAPASGQAQINGKDLKPGIYIYTLMVNGQAVASKTMVINN